MYEITEDTDSTESVKPLDLLVLDWIRKAHKDCDCEDCNMLGIDATVLAEQVPAKILDKEELEEKIMSLKPDKEHSLIYIEMKDLDELAEDIGYKGIQRYQESVSRRLRSMLMGHDHVSRIIEGEIALLLPYCSLLSAIRVSERIPKLLSETIYTADGRSHSAKADISVVPIQQKGTDIICAREAVKRQKRKAIPLSLDPEYISLEQIKNAIAKNRFQLYFQDIAPIKGTSEGDRYEILVRLYDENGKIFSPAEFIPLAEKHDVMPKLDLSVVRRFFSGYNQIYCNGSGRRLDRASLNLSGKTLSDPDTLAEVDSLFDEFKVPPEKICFEVTETAEIRNHESALQFINAVKARGCKFALDDFGTGFSNYDYLTNLPIDYVKIDGSLVQQIVENSINRFIVGGIAKVAKMMNLTTIAEFVSNQEILDCLRGIGVDYVQGWAIGKAEPRFEGYL